MSLFFGAFALYILGERAGGRVGDRGVRRPSGSSRPSARSVSAWALGTPLVSDPSVVPISMLFAFAFLFPDTLAPRLLRHPREGEVARVVQPPAYLAFTFLGDLASLGAGSGAS